MKPELPPVVNQCKIIRRSKFHVPYIEHVHNYICRTINEMSNNTQTI